VTDVPVHKLNFSLRMQGDRRSCTQATLQLAHERWQMFLCTGYTSACTSRVTDIPMHRLHFSLRLQG